MLMCKQNNSQSENWRSVKLAKMENCVEASASAGISPEIEQAAEEALAGLLPSKSRERYETEYDALESWMREKKVNVVNETVLLAYFSEKVCY